MTLLPDIFEPCREGHHKLCVGTDEESGQQCKCSHHAEKWGDDIQRAMVAAGEELIEGRAIAEYVAAAPPMRDGSADNPLDSEPDDCPACGAPDVIEYDRDDGPLTWYVHPACPSAGDDARFAVDSSEHQNANYSTGPVERAGGPLSEPLPPFVADRVAVGVQFHGAYDAESQDWERILDRYQDADDDTRAAINDTLISLCGWSLPSLVRLSRGEQV